MKTIPLSKGMVAVVDDQDYEYLMQWSWYALWNGRSFYAAGSESFPDGTMDHFLMHRIIMRAQPGEFIDHKDLNTLDNRKTNLRRCSKGQNSMNARKRKDNTSGFKGVSKTYDGKWRATIQINGRAKHIGRFETPIEAATAYDIAASQHFGEFALTNNRLGLLSKESD